MVRLIRTRYHRGYIEPLPTGGGGIYHEDAGLGHPARDSGLVGAVVAVLHRAGRPLTSRQIADAVAAAGYAWPRQAVRLRIAHLKRQGRVHRLPGWPYRYVPVGPPPATEGTP